MKNDYNLVTFKTINDFVKELAEIFGEKNHSLKLYERLLEKTTVSHDKIIEKHIDAFRTFCIGNRDMILNKDVGRLSSKVSKVEYSEKVFIDFGNIFKSADKDTKNTILEYLLTISAFVDPTGKAKDILKKDEKSKEADFLTNMIEKVEENVNINSSNPLEAVTSIMSSGIFTELLSNMNNGLQDGSLDLGKLVGTVEKLCNTMAPKGEGAPAGGGVNNINLASMLQGLNLGALSGGGGPGVLGDSTGEVSEVINPTQMLSNMLNNPSFNPDIGK
jgi:hypothetical protein